MCRVKFHNLATKEYPKISVFSVPTTSGYAALQYFKAAIDACIPVLLQKCERPARDRDARTPKILNLQNWDAPEID